MSTTLSRAMASSQPMRIALVNERVNARIARSLGARVGLTAADEVAPYRRAAGGMILALVTMSIVGLYAVAR